MAKKCHSCVLESRRTNIICCVALVSRAFREQREQGKSLLVWRDLVLLGAVNLKVNVSPSHQVK